MRTITLCLLWLVAACGSDTTTPSAVEPAEKATEKTAPDPAPAAHDHHKVAGDAPVGAFTPLTNTEARVFFVEPAEGATVKSPVKIVFGLEGAQVIAAGKMVADSGHHHIIIDAEGPQAGEAVPSDATHVHYGGGQTETELELAPGKHSLTMQFADFAHRSYGPSMSTTIQVTVEE
jgi:hypothetical protein